MEDNLAKQLIKRKDSHRAKTYQRFFKTGPGEYGEDDRFLGISMPVIRTLVKKSKEHTLPEIAHLLKSPWHEVRMAGLLLIVKQYQHSKKQASKKELYHFYLRHLQAANNWDLIDVTVPKVLGDYLLNHPKEQPRYLTFAKSNNLWQKRVAVLACFPLVSHDQFRFPLTIALRLLKDDHDLIQKAVGWMLRELGKRDNARLCTYLDTHGSKMPRTMLRYAIERFEEATRKHYLVSTRT